MTCILILADDVFCAVSEGLGDKIVAIDIEAFYGDEDIARLNETGIVAQSRPARRVNKFQQFFKKHSVWRIAYSFIL